MKNIVPATRNVPACARKEKPSSAVDVFGEGFDAAEEPPFAMGRQWA